MLTSSYKKCPLLFHRKYIPQHPQTQLCFLIAPNVCTTAQLHPRVSSLVQMLVEVSGCGGFRCYYSQSGPSAGADNLVPTEENICLDLVSFRSEFGMSC